MFRKSKFTESLAITKRFRFLRKDTKTQKCVWQRPFLWLVLLMSINKALLSAQESNSLYRWKDEKGVWHFSATPPNHQAVKAEARVEVPVVEFKKQKQLTKLPKVSATRGAGKLKRSRQRCSNLSKKIKKLNRDLERVLGESKTRKKLRDLRWKKLTEC